MPLYANSGGSSGVVAYESDPDSIEVQFHDGSIYLYTNQSAGPGNIITMKRLAQAGRGLNGFINTHVKYKYSKRLR